MVSAKKKGRGSSVKKQTPQAPPEKEIINVEALDCPEAAEETRAEEHSAPGFRVTKENKAEVVLKMEKDLLKVKNLVMAALGAGTTVVTRKEQETLFSIMRGLDVTGERVVKMRKLLTGE